MLKAGTQAETCHVSVRPCHPVVVIAMCVSARRVVASAEHAAASAHVREGVQSSVETLKVADADNKGDTQPRCVHCVSVRSTSSQFSVCIPTHLQLLVLLISAVH